MENNNNYMGNDNDNNDNILIISYRLTVLK